MKYAPRINGMIIGKKWVISNSSVEIQLWSNYLGAFSLLFSLVV